MPSTQPPGPRIQLNDGKGNSFYASKDQEMLHKSGWIVVGIKRRGLIKQVWWTHTKDPEKQVIAQGIAVKIQKDRMKRTK